MFLITAFSPGEMARRELRLFSQIEPAPSRPYKSLLDEARRELRLFSQIEPAPSRPYKSLLDEAIVLDLQKN
jgi:hypothetical protein